MATIFEELRAFVERLSPYYQRRVREFAQELAQTRHNFRRAHRTCFKPPLEKAEAMERALEDCERAAGLTLEQR